MTELERLGWLLGQLNDWTWRLAEAGFWLIAFCCVSAVAVPWVVAHYRARPRPATAILVRKFAGALALTASIVAICSLLHFSDLRWLAPDQRGVHLSGPFTGVLSGIVNVVPEWHAAKLAIQTAIACTILALAGHIIGLAVSRPAAKAELRQMVQAEVAKQLAQLR